jgi:ammonia channel protein AmtB
MIWVRGRRRYWAVFWSGVAGLVAITPAPVFVSPTLCAGDWLDYRCGLLQGATGLKLQYSMQMICGVFGVRGVGGIVGSLLTSVFASRNISGD